jgi:serine O-acetyltransferase
MTSRAEILESLRQVIDPEIGMNVVDLGFIKDVRVEGDEIHVAMVLSAPFCPLAGHIVEQVRRAAETAAGGRRIEVELLDEPWYPPWAGEAPDS